MNQPTPDHDTRHRTDDPTVPVEHEDHDEGKGFFASIFRGVGLFFPVVIVFAVGIIVLLIVLWLN